VVPSAEIRRRVAPQKILDVECLRVWHLACVYNHAPRLQVRRCPSCAVLLVQTCTGLQCTVTQPHAHNGTALLLADLFLVSIDESNVSFIALGASLPLQVRVRITSPLFHTHPDLTYLLCHLWRTAASPAVSAAEAAGLTLDISNHGRDSVTDEVADMCPYSGVTWTFRGLSMTLLDFVGDFFLVLEGLLDSANVLSSGHASRSQCGEAAGVASRGAYSPAGAPMKFNLTLSHP
jgi:ribosomal protein S27E